MHQWQNGNANGSSLGIGMSSITMNSHVSCYILL
jgi:hypothetical protein